MRQGGSEVHIAVGHKSIVAGQEYIGQEQMNKRVA